MTKKVAVLGLLLSLVTALSAAGTGPRISFTELEHDFGDVIHGESPSVEMPVTNTGDEVLVLERIVSSCGCAKGVRGSHRVSPGSSSRIYAQIDTLGMAPGRHSKTIAVHCNDPEHPRIGLKLMFNVIRHVSIDPDTLAVRLSGSDKDAVFKVKATNHWTEPITLKAGTSRDSGQMLMVPQEVVVPPGGKTDFRLSFSIKPDAARPYLKGTAMIETNDPVEKVLPIRYFIQLPQTGGS